MTSIFSYKPEKIQPSPSPQSSESIFRFTPISEEPEGSVEEEPMSFTQRISKQMGESEQLEKDIERSAARTLSRGVERIVGLPGDIAQFAQGITGRKKADFPLPTSSKLQETSEKLTKGYTAPQSEFEQKVDEYVGDVASFLTTPGGGWVKTLKTIGIPLVGNLVKEGVEQKGGTEKQKTGSKLASMVIMDLMFGRKLPGMGGTKKYINTLFKEADASIPSGALADASKLSKSLDALETTLNRGGSAPSTVSALKKIDELRGKIKNGQIEVAELPAFRTKINESIAEAGGWQAQLPKVSKQRAIKNLNDVKRSVIETGIDYGTAHNPTFKQKWTQANEASSAFQQSNMMTNFIKKNYGNKFESTGTKLLFGLGGTSLVGTAHHFAPGAVAAAGGAAALGGTVYQAAKTFQRIKNSPTLARYYGNVLKASAEQNTVQMIQNMQKLDKALAAEEKKEKDLIEKLTKD